MQRQEAERRRQEDMQRRRAEEEERRRQEEVQRKEQDAVYEVRQVIRSLRRTECESIESVSTQLREAMSSRGADCGSQRPKIEEEVRQALQEASDWAEQERKRKEDEEKRKEEEQKRNDEKESTTARLMKELGDLIVSAEGGVTELKERLAPVLENSTLAPSELRKTSAGFKEAKGKAKNACHACTDFLIEKRGTMEEARTVATQTKKELVELQRKIHEAFKLMAECVRGAESKIEPALRKDKADKILEKRFAIFKKYDTDLDDHLKAEEIVAYARGEFSFDLPKHIADKLVKVHGDGRGVPKKDMSRIRTAVGIAREEAAVRHRREEAERRRQELEKERGALQGKLDAASTALEEVETKVSAAEQALQELPEEAASSSELLAEQASEAEKLREAAEAALAAAERQLPELGECSEDHRCFLQAGLRPLSDSAGTLRRRLSRVGDRSKSLQEKANAKEAAERQALRAEVRESLQRHCLKASLRAEELWKAMDKDGDSEVSKADFLAFAADLETSPGEKKLQKFFSREVGKESSKLTKDNLQRLLTVRYKVVAGTVMTEDLIIKGSKAVRRLEAGEAFESQEAPQREEAAEVMRIRGKAPKDGVEGWATIAGNGGKVFLVEDTDDGEKHSQEEEAERKPAAEQASTTRAVGEEAKIKGTEEERRHAAEEESKQKAPAEE